MSSLIWSKVGTDAGSSIYIMDGEGAQYPIGASHINYKSILRELAEEEPGYEERVLALVNARTTFEHELRTLSERVRFDGDHVFLDGDKISGVLADHIVSRLRDSDGGGNGADWTGLVAFLEKVQQNPNPESRDSLYDFVQSHGLTVTKDGDFIAYKGVTQELGSVRRGPGIVNGKPVTGSLSNVPGNLLEMARSQVDSDRSRACGVGLHAGTYRYAKGWGPRVVAVSINPRDVVSVPRDTNFEKLRLARYSVLVEIHPDTKVVATVGVEASSAVWDGPTSTHTATTEKNSARDAVNEVLASVEVGDYIEITYNRGGTPTQYTVKTERLTATHLEGTKNGNPKEFRTFLVENIEAVKAADRRDDAAPQETPPVAPALDLSAVKPGALVEFVYALKGREASYSVLVDSVTPTHITGTKNGNPDEYRTFLVGNIASITRVGAPAAPTPAPSSLEARLAAAVETGASVTVDYRAHGRDPQVAYSVKIISVSDGHVLTRDTAGQHRTFIIEQIVRVSGD